MSYRANQPSLEPKGDRWEAPNAAGSQREHSRVPLRNIQGAIQAATKRSICRSRLGGEPEQPGDSESLADRIPFANHLTRLVRIVCTVAIPCRSISIDCYLAGRRLVQ